MEKLTTILIDKESHKFSAAHFTIFSATDRERLHGHNFSVSARIVAPVDDNGLTGDYAVYKRKLKQICDAIDEYTLIPSQSLYLQISEQDEYYRVTHDTDTMLFLKSDTQLLPVRNTTVEDLSSYLLDTLVEDKAFLNDQDIRELEVMVASGPGQTGASLWQR
ncbi:6-pyruvoyl tetrahydropterin synthase [Halieaceae bacterium IMCC14734]|uniref:6-carboxy-5,6,7,8-tetrahydropterin synthase n=1 Tax=Candidatus Litorirhabdus singularis TaxID=2518993 RepID=A0ABT3TLU6_9GAMM|nr:6-carboxytetrahydropterin synthase [Candidatus Litorirhabdus singularis]MCX2982984.1 6-pyruvoyl tetrahydropterin synthase [Candidatus Litorirhabdus singularis]